MPNIAQIVEWVKQIQALTAKVLLALALVAPPAPPPVVVHTGESIQAAIDAAAPGTDITVQVPGMYDGFVLRNKGAGSAIITIHPDTQLPDGRIDPSDLPSLIQLRPTVGPGSAIATEPGAEGYTLIGLAPQPGFAGTAMAFLGDDTSTDPLNLPGRLVFDRCLFLADPVAGGKRGMMTNTRDLVVRDSYFARFFYAEDSQALGGWNGPGPFLIENNYLEASGENVLFGGAQAMAPANQPAHLTFRHNTVSKDPAWQGVAGITVKNLFELKNLQHAIVEDNVFEYSWLNGQNGFGIVLTPRAQLATPWTSVQDVVFQHNIVRYVGAGINMLGTDDLEPSGPLAHVKILGNLFYGIDLAQWPGSGRLLQMLGGPQDIEIAHNTFVATGHNSFLTLDGEHPKASQINIHDNIFPEGDYGLIGAGTLQGRASWERYTDDASAFEKNLIQRNASGYAIDYPGQSTYTLEAGVAFLGPDFKLLEGFSRLASSDGRPLGANVDALPPH